MLVKSGGEESSDMVRLSTGKRALVTFGDAPHFCFTSDIDWASEYCIRDMRLILDRFGINPTLFVTHRSAEIESWSNAEKGIHPNFSSGSTHGSTISEVVDHVMSLVPEAKTFRSHRFIDSTQITAEVWKRGIRYDSNLCLHLQSGLVPLRHQSGLWRFPIFFEDDCAWLNQMSWDTSIDSFFTPGLKILHFHPFMLATNCPGSEHYEASREYITTLDERSAAAVRYPGKGERTFLLRLLGEIRSRGFEFRTLGELYRSVVQVAATAEACR
jgi:hypothetical protein